MATTDDNVKAACELLRKYAELDLAHLLDLYRQNPNRGNRLLFEERTALRGCLADLVNNSEET
jgi:hypothetical protein